MNPRHSPRTSTGDGRRSGDQGQDFRLLQLGRLRLRTRTVFTTTVPNRRGTRRRFFRLDVPTLYDPLSVNPLCPHRRQYPCQRTAFAGNVIPTDRINPDIAFLLQFIPLPTNGRPTNNFIKAASTGGNVDEYVVRVDQNINATQSRLRTLFLLEAAEPGARSVRHRVLQGPVLGEYSQQERRGRLHPHLQSHYDCRLQHQHQPLPLSTLAHQCRLRHDAGGLAGVL